MLDIFCLISGLKIDLEISIILSINLEERRLSLLAGRLYSWVVASQILGVTFRQKSLASCILESSGF